MEAIRRTPAHLWIVGGLSALWNAFGAFDYVMTQTANEEYLAAFTDAQRDYFASFPTWMDAAWAIGIWGALLGSLLLLARSRYAELAFAASLLGLLASTVWQFVLSDPPADLMSPAMIGFSLLIWAVAIGLFLYARRMRARGVLR